MTVDPFGNDKNNISYIYTMTLYPSLDNNSQFRLQEISTLRSKLETEVQERKQLCKKYKRAQNIFDGMDVGANSIALSLSITSGVLAGTGVLLPFAIPLAITAAGTAAFGILCKLVNRKLKIKASKHANIRQLADAKLNSVLDIISKAINDNMISDEEFKLVTNELNKYNVLKKDIQTKVVTNTHISKNEKKAIIEQAKKDFLSQLQ